MSFPLSAPAITAEALAAAHAAAAPLAGPLNAATWTMDRGLYGGAITAAIPKRFTDCSDFRQIPDHQEVWADADTDQSIIIELNSLDESVPDQLAASHYMQELSVANDALSSELISSGPILPAAMPGFEASIHKSFVVSAQRISKFKESDAKANTVQIYLAVLRLRSVGTDLLVSYNVPQAFAAGSSSEGRAILGSAENVAVIEGVLRTLHVHEWGLFGGRGGGGEDDEQADAVEGEAEMAQ